MRQLPELTPGSRLGPYEIGEELGRGGIAVVYRARHTEVPGLGPLALKIAFRANEQRDKRFIREFERLRVVSIPGVARVFEAGATEELLWYAMDEIDGVAMDRRIGAAGGIDARPGATALQPPSETHRGETFTADDGSVVESPSIHHQSNAQKLLPLAGGRRLFEWNRVRRRRRVRRRHGQLEPSPLAPILS